MMQLQLDSRQLQSVSQLQSLLEKNDLQVLVSFDSRKTRLMDKDSPCPKHKATDCACHVVILLVYAGQPQPISLTVYGSESGLFVSWPMSARQSALTQKLRLMLQQPQNQLCI